MIMCFVPSQLQWNLLKVRDPEREMEIVYAMLVVKFLIISLMQLHL